MIFERVKPKVAEVSFESLNIGSSFIYDKLLFLKVTNPSSDHNAVCLEGNYLWWFGSNVKVTPIKVKIVEVTE